MAREKAKPAELADDAPLNGEVLSAAANQMAEHSALIMAQFGESLPYDRTRVVHEAQFYMAQSSDAMLQAGKRLVLLKEHEAHGDFVAVVQSELGLSPRTAQKMMQAAVKYLSPALQAKAPLGALLNLGKTKLFELMVEDDDDLAALADGGTLAGLTLDEVDRMSRTELQQKLRDSREDYKAQSQVLADKNTLMDAKDREVRKLKRRVAETPAEEAVRELRLEVTGYAHSAELALRGDLARGIDALLNDLPEESISDAKGFAAGFLVQLERAINDIRARHNIPAVLDSNPVPEWRRAGADERVRAAVAAGSAAAQPEA